MMEDQTGVRVNDKVRDLVLVDVRNEMN